MAGSERTEEGFAIQEVRIHELFRGVERRSVAYGIRPHGLWIRVAPTVPPVLKVDNRFPAFVHRIAALGVIAGEGKDRVIDVTARAGSGRDAAPLSLRLDIRYSPTLPGGVSDELRATAGITYLAEGPVAWLEIPAWPVSQSGGKIARGRALVLGDETPELSAYGVSLTDAGLQVRRCKDREDVLREISSPPSETPVRLLLLNGASLLASREEDSLHSFLRSVRNASIPICVAPGAAPPDDELRRIGVMPQLPSPDKNVVDNILALSPDDFVASDGKVTQLEPWRWRERRQRAILVADDLEAVRMVLARCLESLGYIAHTARSGNEALTRLLDNSLHRYQAAILDISMPPGMSGPEVIKRYRDRRPSSKLPMIVLTANDSTDSQMLAAEAGADAYLAKPVSVESLKDTLQQLLTASSEDDRDVDGAAPELPTIDWTVLAEIEGLYSSEAELSRVLTVFSRDAESQVASIEAAARDRSQTGVYMAAQALKSLAAGLGARRLSDVARRIEELRSLPAPGDLAKLIDQLRVELADVLALLSGLRR